MNVIYIFTKFSFFETTVCSVGIALGCGPEILLVFETINLMNSVLEYLLGFLPRKLS
jgi:hypothetical protein